MIDPSATSMWHHLFDPNTQIPPVPLADLKPISKLLSNFQRNESVKDFITKSNVGKSIIKEALEKSSAKTTNEEKAVEEENNKEDEQALIALSQKTGLSLQTLKLIKAKESAIKQSD